MPSYWQCAKCGRTYQSSWPRCNACGTTIDDNTGDGRPSVGDDLLLEALNREHKQMKPTRSYHVRGNTIEVTVTPPAITGFHASKVTLTADQYRRFQSWLEHGGRIQDALPELSADDREILLSGIGPDEWEKTFK
jgi:hypothetical protein